MKRAVQNRKSRTLLALALLGAMAIPAAAQENCTGFGWPVDQEIAWMTAPDTEAIEIGAKIPAPAARAYALKLKPARDVTLPVPPGKKKQGIGAATYSGWFEISGLPKSGLYQISLSHEGWIDAVQNGALVLSHSFTGRPACKALHKSVRYELGTGPLTVQISGAPVETVKVAIREAN
ncbi:MAG: hypothetical protein ACLPX9_06200 [Rhodomicrobium sp.]